MCRKCLRYEYALANFSEGVAVNRRQWIVISGISLLALLAGIFSSPWISKTGLVSEPAVKAFFANEWQSPDGKVLDSKDWQGKVLVVNFWGSWCPPCVEEMPELEKLQWEFSNKNVLFLGIAIDSPSNVREFLKKTPWLDALGEDYIAEAFKAAHEGDPEARLYYNDYGIESPGKREKTLRLIRGLKARGVRIDGVGIQGHWRLDHVPMREIEEAVTAFHAEGLDVMITELDLDVVPRNSTGADVTAREQRTRDPYARSCPEEILRRQAGQYASLFTLFRRHAGKITRVTFWGLHDGRSWLNYWPSKRTNYPLLFDRNLQPKPALTSVIQPSDSSARSSATP